MNDSKPVSGQPDHSLPPLPAEVDVFIEKLYSATPRPPKYICGAVRKNEMKLLARVFLRQAPGRSIEWGLGSGISATTFSFARQFLKLPGKHVALDPFQKEVSDDWGFRCLEEFGQMESVEFHRALSEEFLIQCRREGRKFDFAFIDGAHDIGHKVADACLVADVMADHGIVSFHDSLFDSTAYAIKHLTRERGYRVLRYDDEPGIKRRLRGIKHLPRLGPSFALGVVPWINYAVSFLVKDS